MEDVPKEVAENASQLVLRLRLSAMPVLNTLHAMNALDLKHGDYCFNFHLSIFIDEAGT